MTAAWLDCSSGVSGDMLLGALTDLGALDPIDLARRVPVDVTCEVRATTRAGVAATHVVVEPAADQPHRQLSEVLDIVTASELPESVRRRATAVFRRLAEAEAAVHGVTPETVIFHEVGAVDSIVDVLGVCAGIDALALESLTASPIALGGGTIRAAHGRLSVPGPAVLRLLAGTSLTAHGGPGEAELATPTGVALVAEWADASGVMPELTVSGIGTGAGGRDDPQRPNVLRLVVGAAAAQAEGQWLLLETNVDDLDPRLWPVVIQRLLAAGAADAWLTPIVMKKGRPALTLSALVTSSAVDVVQRVVFEETSAIGLRTSTVAKKALDREWMSVLVEGHSVRVKLARSGDVVVNASPEFDDVLRAAEALGKPVKVVLAAAVAAAERRSRR